MRRYFPTPTKLLYRLGCHLWVSHAIFWIYFGNIRYIISSVCCIIKSHKRASLKYFWFLLLFFFIEIKSSSHKCHNFLSILKFILFYLPPWFMCSIVAIIMFGASWSLSIVAITNFRNDLCIYLYFPHSCHPLVTLLSCIFHFYTS